MCIYSTPWSFNVAIEYGHWWLVYPYHMVICTCYITSPGSKDGHPQPQAPGILHIFTILVMHGFVSKWELPGLKPRHFGSFSHVFPHKNQLPEAAVAWGRSDLRCIRLWHRGKRHRGEPQASSQLCCKRQKMSEVCTEGLLMTEWAVRKPIRTHRKAGICFSCMSLAFSQLSLSSF